MDAVRSIKNINDFFSDAEEKLGLPPGTYDFYDQYGVIKTPQDLQRALTTAGTGECIIEVKEHLQFIRIKELQSENDELKGRLNDLEQLIQKVAQDADKKLDVAMESVTDRVVKVEKKMTDEVIPLVESVNKDKIEMQKDIRSIIEKLNAFNINELRDLSASAMSMRDDLQAMTKRLNILDTQWQKDKGELRDQGRQTAQDLKDLQKYIMGKIDICIEADADLRRDQQIGSERMQIVADDLRLLLEDHNRLQVRCNGALEESEELRMLLGQVREDNEHLRHDNFAVSTRVLSLEGTATERWTNFTAGVLYFRSWHRTAKGEDVQLSADLSCATGRGFLAATGVVIGNDEGLAVGDGPCRHFGTPGCFNSYFELEIEEVCAAPAGSGGLFVGVAIQSGQEITGHPKKEFDGWMMGGNSKALICRAGSGHMTDMDKLPDTFAPGADERSLNAAKEAVKALRAALPRRVAGEVKEVESVWKSEGLRMGDRVGVLFRCNRDGGARMRVTVNGDIIATHNFLEAPPAEAVGFLTPVVRLAGTGKAAKLLPGLAPPSRILADDI